MSNPLYEFAPSANTIKGPHAFDTTIIIQSKNVAFYDEIPKQFVNSGIEDFVKFFKSGPLWYVVCNFPNPFYPKQVCEFYYTCSVDTISRTISGTIGYGQYKVTIDVESLRTALCLPLYDSYSKTTSKESCKTVRKKLGYNFKLKGLMCDPYRDTLRQCFNVGWKYLTGVIGRCLGHKTGSLDQLNFFEQRILYSIVDNKKLDFAQILLDHTIKCCSRNKRPVHVPYPRWLGLMLSHEEGYVDSHRIIFPIPALSSKIINVVPSMDDSSIIARMRKWIENPYVVEYSDSEKDNDNDDDGDEEGNDDENSEVGNQDGVEKGEDTDKDENNPATGVGDDFTQNMNSHPRINNHIHFSSTSPSPTDDTELHGSTPLIRDTTEPMIQDEPSLTPSPSPQADTTHQAETVPLTPSPINFVVLHQGDQGKSNSKFETVVLSQLSLIVQLTQSMDKRLTEVERNVAIMKRLMALDDDDDIVVDNTPPNSPCDNPPPPPPPSTNPPLPSHPPPRTPSPLPNSPPQSDAAKKGENYQEGPQLMQMQMVISSQPEMTGRSEAKPDPLELIVVVDIPDADAEGL
ncbi:hypothetical protein Lser_V15G38004 [Lactuca serriola]